MKKYILSLATLAMISSSFVMTSCKDEDKPTPGNGGGVEVVEGEVQVMQNITKDTKWTADKVYVLRKRIYVTEGATLTIEPGTVIKGQAGKGVNASALIIARGAKIMAEGTAEKPIIFTATADEIKSGQIASPNLENDTKGLWGGLLILGKAPVSVKGDGVEFQIEGIPASESLAKYGGTDPNDNSGVLKYVSIRHGGADLSDGNEINGLSLGGVGSGTVIENIEIVSNLDDGVEWFGGTVNVKNLLVWNVKDDAIDTDQAWSGTLDGFVVITPNDNALELDGPEGSKQGTHTIKNGYISMKEVAGNLIDTDPNSMVHLENIYIANPGTSKIKRLTAAEGVLTFKDILVNTADLSSVLPDGATSFPGITAGTKDFDKSAYKWTWAYKHTNGSF